MIFIIKNTLYHFQNEAKPQPDTPNIACWETERRLDANRPVASRSPRSRTAEGVADGAGRGRGGLRDCRPSVIGVEEEGEGEIEKMCKSMAVFSSFKITVEPRFTLVSVYVR